MEVLFFWFGIAVVTGFVASSRGRTGFGWFLLGCMFSILALILVALLPPLIEHKRAEPVRVDPSNTPAMKTCPRCAEPVRAAAVICRYCNYEFAALSSDDLVLSESEALTIDKTYPSYVAGLRHEIRDVYAARHINVGDIIGFAPEPTNRHDENAVALYHRQFQIGYIPRKHDWIIEAIRSGKKLEMRVTKVETSGILIYKRATLIGLAVSVMRYR